MTAKYQKLSMVSAITNKGKVSWMIVDGSVNIERFIKFLERLLYEMKYGIGSKAPVRKKENLRITTDEHMAFLKSKPERIKKYFENPAISYGALTMIS